MRDEIILGRKEDVAAILKALGIKEGGKPEQPKAKRKKSKSLEELSREERDIISFFGKPLTGYDTGCFVGGPNGKTIYKKGKPTKYFIGGPSGSSIMSWSGEKIGRVGGPSGNEIFTVKLKPTGYFIGGPSGIRIYFDEKRKEILKKNI